jgi:hypothetical protein
VYDPRNPNIPAANANIPHSVSQMIGDSEMFVAGSGMAANYARINLHNGASTAVVPGAHTNKFSIAGDDKHVSIICGLYNPVEVGLSANPNPTRFTLEVPETSKSFR